MYEMVARDQQNAGPSPFAFTCLKEQVARKYMIIILASVYSANRSIECIEYGYILVLSKVSDITAGPSALPGLVCLILWKYESMNDFSIPEPGDFFHLTGRFTHCRYNDSSSIYRL